MDWRTVKKYLAADAPSTPPAAPSRAGTQPRAITPELELLIRSWLAKDIELKASVIHERLVDEHGFTGHYQRVKMACQVLRPAVAAELDLVEDNPLVGLHRRFSTIPGAQAQVDWGDCGLVPVRSAGGILRRKLQVAVSIGMANIKQVDDRGDDASVVVLIGMGHQILGPRHDQFRFFQYLTDQCLFHAFIAIDKAARQAPFALARIASAADK